MVEGPLSGQTGGDGSDGRLAQNILMFCRTLRAAGLPVGPDRVMAAVDAAAPADRSEPSSLSRRLSDALQPESRKDGPPERSRDERPERDAALTFSRQDVLKTIDFKKMSGEEMRRAKQAIETMRLPIMAVPTRRFRAAPRGRQADPRRTFRAALRTGGDTIRICRKRRARRAPPLIMLCDISGSMGRYSRMLLHFLHTVTNSRDRVHAFLFGTRLSNISRSLRHRDVDLAVARVAAQVEDWSGGTKIGACLREFNLRWSRRVQSQGAIVLLVTDGLDRKSADLLGQEIERLQRSCRWLIWLNPLLGYADYRPAARSAKAMIAHVDEFRPVHNLASLDELTEALSRPPGQRSQRLARGPGSRPSTSPKPRE